MNTIAIHRLSWTNSQHFSALIKGFAAHRLLYAISLVCIFAALLEVLLLGMPLDLKLVYFFSFPIFLTMTILITLGLLMEMLRLFRSQYAGRLGPALWSKLTNDYFAPQRLSNAVHSIICMTLFMSGFTLIKAAIPVANPFSWDKSFVALDKALHFGVHPYEALAPILNTPLATFALNVNYNIWFFVMFGFCLWHGFARQDNRLRQHYFVAFMFTWLLGTGILGTIFSSVGPGLYSRMYPQEIDTFQPLLVWLHHVNETYSIFALVAMDELWLSYSTGEGMINGISAMPSMHVGTSVLFVLTSFAAGKRWLGWSMVVFGTAILLGSIHLGWHYAIDGYLGAVVGLVCWWGARKVVTLDCNSRGAV